MRTPCPRSLFPLLAALVVVLATRYAEAQLAPTGAHYGARASDTGHAGAVVGGGYSASVPLELPAPRGELPVPLEIAYTDRGVGAAGLAWDIPLSYIRRTASLAHRRPSANAPGGGFERVSVVLGGREIPLIQVGGVWIAHQDAPKLEVTEDVSTGIWTMQDGEGFTYSFSEHAPLTGVGLWLLDAIASPAAANSVELEYEVSPHAVGAASGVSVDLVALRYDVHPDIGCKKHEIALLYGAPAPAPISLTMLDDTVLVRTRTLEHVDVTARATCTDPLETIRRYDLSYAPDADTQRPRLQQVRMAGREGTPENATTIPVQSFQYGTATWADPLDPGARKLRYLKATDVALPADVDQAELSSTYRDTTVSVPHGNPYATWQSLTDVTGDGRPDLVYRKNDDLWVALNRPGASGSTTIGQNLAIGQLTDATLGAGPFATRTSPHTRFSYADAEMNPDEVWRQTIDVNGDGRLDIIDAAEEPNVWAVYLNTPGNTTSGVTWVRRVWGVQGLRDILEARGYELDDDWIPLSRRFTGRDQSFQMCWKSLGGGNWEMDDSVTCANGGVIPWTPIFPGGWAETTYTEWELADVNGDGYPDFLFDANPVELTVGGEPSLELDPGFIIDGNVNFFVGWGGYATSVEVAFNAVGVRHENPDWPFTDPSVWVGTTFCGVSSWIQDSPNHQSVQTCGQADVNGDGLLDRVEEDTALLGTGWSLTGVEIELPSLGGPYNRRLARQYTLHESACTGNPTPPGTKTYATSITDSLRDLTGDGIPDFVEVVPGDWWVHVGTGFGFAPPIRIVVPGSSFELSRSTETCNGDDSSTTAGLFDIDGDGKPDVVKVGGSGNLEVYQLTGAWVARSPDAGRLTLVDNGYGAQTKVGWRSAKEDGTTLHQVPYPELVVDSVETLGTLGLGGSGISTRYAYGDARMIFDPRRDAFLLPAYGRTVELRVQAAIGSKGPGIATITDTLPLGGFSTGLTPVERYARYALAGRPSDVWSLTGELPGDPWELLTANMATDARRKGGAHYGWAVSAVQETMQYPNLVDCMDIPYPYDWPLSFTSNQGTGYYFCGARGFAYTATTETWRGDQAPPSLQNVATRSEVLAIDGYGRVTSMLYNNDLYRADDDLCVDTSYATPQSAARVLDAEYMRLAYDCTEGMVLAADVWEFDDLPIGQVVLGHTTGHTFDRHDVSNGAYLETVHAFDALYDNAGNVVEVVSLREDGTKRLVHTTYDPFRLAAIEVKVEADGAAPQQVTVNRDPLTLEGIDAQDLNKTLRSREVDGFGRETRTLAAPPGGNLGVTAITTYLGFGGAEPLGRRIRTKSFADPVPESQVATTPGQTGTVFLDEVGRKRRIEIELGSDYGGEMLVARQTYDGFGRLAFESDPHPTSQAEPTAYGTSHYYKTDGTPTCSIRGYGPQPYNAVTDEATERYPTCYERTFANHAETLAVRTADSLLASSNQAGVVRSTTETAIGRTLSRQTFQGTNRLEYVDYGYDRLGHTTRVTRYLDPVTLLKSVTWNGRFDSHGQQLQVSEPESATRFYEYSHWGELLRVKWTDAGVERRVERQYDGLSRVVHASDWFGGQEIQATIYDYIYDDDQPVPVPEAQALHLRGRLARAKSPLGDVFIGYDAWGNVASRTWFDENGEHYVEATERHFDGRLANIDFFLPDTGHALERTKYEYDSAGRLRSVAYNGPADSAVLFEADVIDTWGRLRAGAFGPAVTYHADYADVGRRLPEHSEVSSPLGSRSILHLGYDPMGRERSRREIADGAPTGPKTNIGYDALGRISGAVKSTPNAVLYSAQFTHDPLGNTISLAEGMVPTLAADLSYRNGDRDRICRIGYGGSLGGTDCNVVHDGTGNIVEMPTRTSKRLLSYFPSGQVESIAQGAAKAKFHYDPFGDVASLEVEGIGVTDLRRDRRFGGLIERRDHYKNGSPKSVVVRNIPGSNGIIATRRGEDGWIFAHGEGRGSRLFTDESGAIVQDVDYRPYGESTSTGAQPGSPEYSVWQWNGGDALAAFGLSHLGARIYDPVIGRFLSRDPMLVQRTAATSNPYAFALEDPWNRSDPTGLDSECPPGDGKCTPKFEPLKLPLDLVLAVGASIFGKTKPPRVAPWNDKQYDPKDGAIHPPFYNTTFDRHMGIGQLKTEEEKEIFLRSSYDQMESELKHHGERGHRHLGYEMRKIWAYAAVVQHRYTHRFDGMTRAEARLSAAAEKYEIDRAQAHRILLFTGDDRQRWGETAKITPAVVYPGAWEVWAHGNPHGMVDRSYGGTGYDAGKIVDALKDAGWKPGQPIALVGCTVGQELNGVGQQVATLAKSPVFASTSSTLRPEGYSHPLMVPYGWSYFEPK